MKFVKVLIFFFNKNVIKTVNKKVLYKITLKAARDMKKATSALQSPSNCCNNKKLGNFN